RSSEKGRAKRSVCPGSQAGRLRGHGQTDRFALPFRIISLVRRKCFIYYLTMDVKKDLAEIAALIGEPTRVVMLWSLLGGEARPASGLAFYANVSAQNASAHLARLVEAGMLAVGARGRPRCFLPAA